MKRLMKVIDEVKCTKDKTNDFGKYKYRSCEDILVAVKPLLVKEGLLLTLTDDIIATEHGRYYIGATATVYDAETKEVIQQTRAFAREPDEKKGTDPSQISGTASSYARKYALNGLLLLDDNKDADTNEYHIENEAREKAAKPKAKSAKVKEEPKEEPKAEEPRKASVQQLQVIQDLILKTGKKEEDICKAYKVKKLQDITVENAAEIYKVLRHYEEEL